MPSSEYTTGGGGALKIKGVGGIDKKKKKKRPKPDSTEPSASTVAESSNPASKSKSGSRSPTHTHGRPVSPDTAESQIREASGAQGRRKTEAEKRHDEMRRKRLEERLKREGVKTHKEKVEELNKYLSGLSEHHDMPKIGPG